MLDAYSEEEIDCIQRFFADLERIFDKESHAIFCELFEIAVAFDGSEILEIVVVRFL